MTHVAVVGGGAAGLAAAWSAARAGARVTLLEGYERLGGTTALSGGNAWLPGNDHTPDDTAEAGLTYLRELALGDANDEMLEVFAREAGPTAARLERETPVRWQPIAYSDYHAHRPGGRPQGGRTLEPKPIDPDERARELVRDAPNVTAPVTYVELATGEIDKEELARRAERGTLTLGRALLAALVEACLDAGVEFETGTRVRELPDADAVVLTTGGFERDPELARAFLRGPMLAPVGAPSAAPAAIAMRSPSPRAVGAPTGASIGPRRKARASSGSRSKPPVVSTTASASGSSRTRVPVSNATPVSRHASTSAASRARPSVSVPRSARRASSSLSISPVASST